MTHDFVGDGVARAVRLARAAVIEGLAVLVLSLVVVASLVDEALLVAVSVDGDVVTAKARASIAAVNDVLDADVSGRPGTLAEDVDAVSDGRGASVGPARATAIQICEKI